MRKKGGINLGSGWKYFITQGFKNLRHHRLVSLASSGIVAASLLLFGVFLLLDMNLQVALGQLRDQCEINVYLSGTAEGTEITRIENEIRRIAGIKEVRFLSREERLQMVKETTYQGKEELLSDLEADNPLRDSYVLTIENLEEASRIAEEAGRVSGVEEVVNLLDLTEKVRRFADGSEKVGLGLMLLFALVAVFIIANTIRMGMVARSHEISIMHSVGASGWYICGPFLVEGILLGFFGALLGGGLLLWGYDALVRAFGSLGMGDVFAPVPLTQAAPMVLVTFVALGVGIGLLGSGFSVGRYRK